MVEQTRHPLKIFVVRTDRSACWYYRMELPLRALAARGHKVTVCEQSLPLDSEGRFPPGVKEWADVVVFQRLGIWRDTKTGHEVDLPAALLDLRRYVAVVQDNDDYMAAIDPWNPARSVWKQQQVEAHYRTIAEVTVNTFSTRHLGEATTEELLSRGLAVPMWRVLPNCLPPTTGNRPRKSPLFSVVLAGSKSHVGDWLLVARQLAEWVARHEDARLVCIGWGVDTLLDWCDEAVELQRILERLPRVSSYEWLEYRVYMQALARCHVLVAPLADTRFNWCKSDIKAKEAALAHVYAILSPVGEYCDWIERYAGRGICSALHPQSLEDVLDDCYGRWKRGESVINVQAAEDVTREWEMMRHVEKWERAYRQAMLVAT